MIFRKLIFILFLFSGFVACSKKVEKVELKYTSEEFTKLSAETSPMGSKGEGDIKFSEYAQGANHLESKGLIYKRLSFFAISFETVEQARLEALRLNQYFARNWLFDRVQGEPVLEDYVIENFKAINPNKLIQRVPKKAVEGHHEGHHEGAPAHH
jgi:hypothetical protein